MPSTLFLCSKSAAPQLQITILAPKQKSCKTFLLIINSSFAPAALLAEKWICKSVIFLNLL